MPNNIGKGAWNRLARAVRKVELSPPPGLDPRKDPRAYLWTCKVVKTTGTITAASTNFGSGPATLQTLASDGSLTALSGGSVTVFNMFSTSIPSGTTCYVEYIDGNWCVTTLAC